MSNIYLIVTLWSYPFGGGESFMLQTMKWAHDNGMKSYWISFSSSNGDHTELKIIRDKYGTMIHIPGGFNEENILNWTKLFNPKIVHTQGNRRREIIETISKLRIPILTGYHFWGGAIDLNPLTNNRDILNNISRHKKSNELDIILKNKYTIPYVCSDFMQDIIQKVCNVTLQIMYPSSGRDVYVDKINVLENKFVTHINIHKLKGGDIFYELVKNLFDIPFIGIKTENNSEELDRKIMDIIKQKRDGSLIIEHTKNIGDIYKTTRILIVPSIVDETFCRVINEGLMNGLPIVTTGSGNIKYLVGDAAIILKNDPNSWIKTVSDLYYDEEKLHTISLKSKEQYKLFSETIAINQFKMFIDSSIKSSKENNIMLFIPFCDQGLGIQGRSYLNLLKDKFQVFIFSYMPYNADKINDLQKDSDEWKYDKIYYSKNTREKVEDEEIISFVISNNIGKCIIPETCWSRVFEISNLLRRLNVKIYAIPNIEIVRKDEIYKHRIFDKILCNNQLCENYFREFGFNNVENIGYAIEQKIKPKKTSDNFIFLCIGGMNAFTRKQIPEVCESFVKIYDQIKLKKPQLIVTIQKFYNAEKIAKYIKHPAIKIINEHLSCGDIQNLYSEADVFIQVSKKEGLGLGFFEALRYGVPILTLDTAPHNEIVKDNINGWVCICKHEKMDDNPEALLEDAIVNVDLLSEKMIEILTKYDMTNIQRTTILDYKQRFSIRTFKQRLIHAIQ